jgi:hypothetical protein
LRKETTMPPRGVKKGSKRERQYEHIEKSEREAGRSSKRAEEIAARAVYDDAKKLGIEGRSRMSKKELQHAVAGAS